MSEHEHWTCDWPYPHFTHFWSDGTVDYECQGYGDERDEREDDWGWLGLLALLTVGVLFFALWLVSTYAEPLSAFVERVFPA